MILVPVNFEDPGLGLALLAMLVGLRVGVFVFDKLRARRAEFEEDIATPLETPAVALAADGCAVLPAPSAIADPLDTPALELPPPSPADDVPVEAIDVEPVDVALAEPDAIAAEPIASDAVVQEDDDEACDEEAEGRRGRFFVELLDSAIIAVILVFWVIRPFIVSAYFIPTPSMEPTLMRQDKLLATRVPYWFHPPRRGDVVVFNAPEIALYHADQRQTFDPKRPTEYVKRVIGVPGDRIKVVAERGVFVNGELRQDPETIPTVLYDFPNPGDFSEYQEPPVRTTPRDVCTALRPHINEDWELVVPEGQLFVMGDNRNNSGDSHVWGLLPRDRVIAKASVIFWPPQRWGVVK